MIKEKNAGFSCAYELHHQSAILYRVHLESVV